MKNILIVAAFALLLLYLIERKTEVVTAKLAPSLPGFKPTVLGMPQEFSFLTSSDFDEVVEFWIDPPSGNAFDNRPGMIRNYPITILTDPEDIANFFRLNPLAVDRLRERKVSLLGVGITQGPGSLYGTSGPPLPTVRGIQ
jgi:hypothetical protein